MAVTRRAGSAGGRSSRQGVGRALAVVGLSLLLSYGVSLQAANAGGRGYSHRVMKNDPVGYWRLNETSGDVAYDATGNFNGKYVQTPTVGAPGLLATPSGHSVWLDGSDQRVTADSMTQVTAWPGYTLEAWVRIDQVTREEHIVAFNDYSGGNGLAVLHDQPTGLFKFRDCEGPGCVQAFSTTVPQVGGRYYVVVTVNRQNQGRLFIDGEREAIFNSDKRPLVNALLTIGGEYDTRGGNAIPSSFFHGNIDEVAIYNHALRPRKVRAHYKAGLWSRP
jgi:Concanavalin A-like lectin/glucanases superfamily